MKMQTNHYGPRIIRRPIEIWVPHNSEEITFAYPYVCGDYKIVGKQILDKNQLVLTGDCAASLFYSVYCNEKIFNEAESRDIRSEIKGNWF